MKTEEELLAYPPYTVFRTYLDNGVMIIAYQSPNGLWWSSWKLHHRTELWDLCAFVSNGQPPEWPGWEILRSDNDKEKAHG